MTLSIAVLPLSEADEPQATALAANLSLPLLAVQAPDTVQGVAQLLLVSGQGLALQPLHSEPESRRKKRTGGSAQGATRVDFVEGKVAHRQRFGGGKGQDIAKAAGFKGRFTPEILDATAGLGRDSYVFASLGARVQMLERSPVVAALLADGLVRAAEDEIAGPVVARMTLHSGSAHAHLTKMADNRSQVDVVYLDPMFPHREKSALVKKEMRAFQQLLGPDLDADGLLPLALAVARFRVVVKRPRGAPDLNDQSPTYRLEGKAGRFDVYVNQKLPA